MENYVTQKDSSGLPEFYLSPSKKSEDNYLENVWSSDEGTGATASKLNTAEGNPVAVADISDPSCLVHSYEQLDKDCEFINPILSKSSNDDKFDIEARESSQDVYAELSTHPIEGMKADETIMSEESSPAPNFLVGGAISSQTSLQSVKNSWEKSNEISGYQTTVEVNNDPSPLTPEYSAAKSLECHATPSLASVSSLASSKKLEWDSGADVGYHKKGNVDSASYLSTLERAAIRNYALSLITEMSNPTYSAELAHLSAPEYKFKPIFDQDLNIIQQSLSSSYSSDTKTVEKIPYSIIAFDEMSDVLCTEDSKQDLNVSSASTASKYPKMTSNKSSHKVDNKGHSGSDTLISTMASSSIELSDLPFSSHTFSSTFSKNTTSKSSQFKGDNPAEVHEEGNIADTEMFVPYRPPSSTRTYYLALSEAVELANEGSVQDTPIVEIRPPELSESEDSRSIMDDHQLNKEKMLSSFDISSVSAVKELANQVHSLVKEESNMREALLLPRRFEPIKQPLSSDISSSADSTTEATKKKYVPQRVRSRRQPDYTPVTGTDGDSSYVSVVKFRKKMYTKKIQKYIQTLERLEKALVPRSDESFITDDQKCYKSSGFTSHTDSELYFEDKRMRNKSIRRKVHSCSSSAAFDDVSSSKNVKHRENVVTSSDNDSRSITGDNTPNYLSIRQNYKPHIPGMKSVIFTPESSDHDNIISKEKITVYGVGFPIRENIETPSLESSRHAADFILPAKNIFSSDEISFVDYSKNSSEDIKKQPLSLERDISTEVSERETDGIKSNKSKSVFLPKLLRHPDSVDMLAEGMLTCSLDPLNQDNNKYSNNSNDQQKLHVSDQPPLTTTTTTTTTTSEIVSNQARTLRDFTQMFPSSADCAETRIQVNNATQTDNVIISRSKGEVYNKLPYQRRTSTEEETAPSVPLKKHETMNRMSFSTSESDCVQQMRKKPVKLQVSDSSGDYKVTHRNPWHRIYKNSLPKPVSSLSSEEYHARKNTYDKKSLVVKKVPARGPPITTVINRGFKESANRPKTTTDRRKKSEVSSLSQTGSNKPCVIQKEELDLTKENKKGIKFTVHMKAEKKFVSTRQLTLSQELVEMNKKKQILTLNEALSLSKPEFIDIAEKRRQKICKKQIYRKESQLRNHDALAVLPDNLRTQSVLQKFLVKPSDSPLFSYKSMRLQNKRLYGLLPESEIPSKNRMRAGTKKTNQLMAQLYSRKLRQKTLGAKCPLRHEEVVTPLR